MKGIARHGPAEPPSARVCVAQRVVHAVGVAVEALCSGGVVNESIDGEERTHLRVVHPAVHVDEAEGGDVLVQGVAAVEGVRHVVIPEAVGVAATAPGVIAQPLHGVATYGGRQVALVVFQGVVHVMVAFQLIHPSGHQHIHLIKKGQDMYNYQ